MLPLKDYLLLPVVHPVVLSQIDPTAFDNKFETVEMTLAMHIHISKKDFVTGYRCSKCRCRFYGSEIADLIHGCMGEK